MPIYQVYLTGKTDALLHQHHSSMANVSLAKFIAELVALGLNYQAEAQMTAKLKHIAQNLDFLELGDSHDPECALEILQVTLDYIKEPEHKEMRHSILEDVQIRNVKKLR